MIIIITIIGDVNFNGPQVTGITGDQRRIQTTTQLE